ncbi:MAG: hypothetical protein AAF518_23520 [Spirochaetota bacterium]
MKLLKLGFIILLFTLISCGNTSEEEESSSDFSLDDNTTTLLLLAAASQQSGSCGNTTVSSSGEEFSYDSDSTYTICGDISTTSQITFNRAGTYKITATAGSVEYSHFDCNSVYRDITISLSNSDSTSFTSGSEKTVSSGDTMSFSASRPSSTLFECGSSIASQSTQSNYSVVIEPVQ